MESLAFYLLSAFAILWYVLDFVSAKRALEFRRVAWLIALAFFARLLAAVLWGKGDPYDIESWGMLARAVIEQKNAYVDPIFVGVPPRLPWLPFQIYFFALAEIFARSFDLPFVTVVKIIPILADVGITALVFYGARALTRDNSRAWHLGLLYALNPLSILDVSIHGQFDSIPLLCALAAWFVFQFNAPRRFNATLTGLLLGIGILDKTWPVILLPLFLIKATTWRSRTAIALFAGGVPFVGTFIYALIVNGNVFQILSVAASYQSIAGTWGWTQLIGLNWASLAPTEATVFGKLLALGALGIYYAYFARKLDLMRGMLSAVLLLFAVAPGLNIYYLMWLVPFALLANGTNGLRVFIAPAFLWMANFYFSFNPLGIISAPILFTSLALLLWGVVIGWLVANLKNISLPRFNPYLALLAALSIFAIGPLLGPGYFWGAHDGRHSVYFLYEFDRAIQDGVFYPRWAPDFTFGYGYPFFNIYAPGAYFIGEALHLIGFEFVTAVKIVFGLAIIFSGFAMFGFVKRLTRSDAAAFIAGLVYIYIPYHIVDVYVRANLAESVALVFLPLAFWGFYETVLNPNRVTILVAALAYGATLFTHNGIALLITPVLGLWVFALMIWRARDQSVRAISAFVRRGLAPMFSLLLGIGLASIFAIPAVLEFQAVSTQQWLGNYYDYTNHFVYLYQLFSPFWGFGISKPGPVDDMSFQFGVTPILLAIFSMVAIVRNHNGMRRVLIFFAVMTIVIAILMLAISLPIWEALRITTFAQFPWRLLTLATISLSILAGAIILTDDAANESHNVSLSTLLLGALILLGSFPYLNVPTQVEAKEGQVGALGLLKFEQSANEMTGITAWVQEQPSWSPMADVIVANKKLKSKIDYTEFSQDEVWIGVIPGGLRANGERIAFTSTGDNNWITFNQFYYPGWRVYFVKPFSAEIIGELPIQIVGEYGRMRVQIPRGEHWLMLRFDDTPARAIGALISAASVLLALGILIWEIRVQRKSHARAAR
ncbi:MAG: hypothetical protein HY070_13725 [Chloroflexi bacterium]|nr:hypothetical protein [Chloroflexota bacterium]